MPPARRALRGPPGRRLTRTARRCPQLDRPALMVKLLAVLVDPGHQPGAEITHLHRSAPFSRGDESGCGIGLLNRALELVGKGRLRWPGMRVVADRKAQQ